MAQVIRRNALALVAVLVALLLMLIILLVLAAVHGNIARKAQAELGTGLRVFERLMEDRNEQLASHAKLLANDLRFQQAIAKHAITRNDQEIMHWLEVHRNSIQADAALLVDSQGRTLPSRHAASMPDSLHSQLSHHQATNEAVAVAALVNGRLYQMVFAPLQHAEWRAWVGIGFELDQDFLERVRTALGMHVSLLMGEGGEARWISTLPPTSLPPNGSDGSGAPTRLDLIENLESQGWQSLSNPLEQSSDGLLWSVFSTSMIDEYEAFINLRNLLVIGGVLALILVVVVTVWLRRRLDRTLESFAAAAQHIAQGDYSKPVSLGGDSGLRWLESALSKIQRAIQEREHHLNFHVQHDPVTGLSNKHHTETRVRARLKPEGDEKSVLLIVLQIRRLSQLRHLYDRDLVEGLIKGTAKRAQAVLAAEDIIGRLEDDQFLLFLDDFQEDQIPVLRQQLINLFHRPFVIGEMEFHLDVAAGAVFCFPNGLDYYDLLRRCRLALAKANTEQSPFELYRKGQDDLHLRRARISHEIPLALKENEFQLVYQPQLNLKHGNVERVEALLRWRSKKLGLLSPGEFIPLAEGSGQIGAITCWLISAVVDQVKQWKEEGLSLEVSINLSANDLIKDEVIQHLIRSLEAASLQASQLTLEVTESTMIQQPDKTIRTLRRLHQQGFKLAMDDFGTGFSSLSQIKALPLQELKIDQSFVLNLDRDREDQTIVNAAIHMAHTLGLEVVAEGVENSKSLSMLQSLGCDGIQGNFLAEPMRNEELKAWLLALHQNKNFKDGPVAWAGIA